MVDGSRMTVRVAYDVDDTMLLRMAEDGAVGKKHVSRRRVTDMENCLVEKPSMQGGRGWVGQGEMRATDPVEASSKFESRDLGQDAMTVMAGRM